jgi:Uma2 family endonuclease
MRTWEASMMAVMHEDRIAYHRITVDQYYRMAEVGVLSPDERVELIDGVIIDMAPIGSRHAGALRRLNQLFTVALGARAIVSGQLPVRLGHSSESQPDLAVLKPRDDFYDQAHPQAADVLLLVEVSVTSVRYDLQMKVPLYARHRIPEVWVIDLRDQLLHVYRTPKGGSYAEVTSLSMPGTITLTALPDVEIDLSGILRE